MNQGDRVKYNCHANTCSPPEPTRNEDLDFVERQAVRMKQGIHILFLHSVCDAKHLVIVAGVLDRILFD